MIPRYTTKEYADLWSAETQFRTWYEVEMAAVRAMCESKQIPQYAIAELEASGIGERIDPARIAEIERETRHDVIAFLTHMEELAGDHARWMHVGMTSSDVVDTGLALLLTRAVDGILRRVGDVRHELARLARRHAESPMMGRTHGMYAEPTTFGAVVAGHLQEFTRCEERLRTAREEVRFGKMSGAVGNFAHGRPETEARAMELLGLKAEPVSTQVVPRDRHAALASACTLCAAAVERLATTVRHLSRTEVAEVMEGFAPGQKGSSAMPHKRNPIASENLCGCARLMRGYADAIHQDVALWHERDISHSAVERVALADATTLLAYMLERTESMVAHLVVDSGRMLERVRSTTLWGSEGVLLALVRAGVRRQEAYVWVQACAMAALSRDPAGSGFSDEVLSHPEISQHVRADELRRCFDLRHQVRHAPWIVDVACRDA